jgi:hypothetical protein
VAENNGMTIDQLKQLFLTVETVVIGVGFFLALPQTLPADPRHRISCPKMNPSRTFTPEGTFSWGGTAIAIYATDSPGGYMPTGMTIPGVDIFGHKAGFTPDRPWLFEDMDVITFYEVTTEEYDAKMLQFKAGTYQFEYTESFFDVGAHNKLLADTKEEVKLLSVKRADAQSRMLLLEKELLAQWDQERQAGAVSLDSVKSLLEGKSSHWRQPPIPITSSYSNDMSCRSERGSNRVSYASERVEGDCGRGPVAPGKSEDHNS